MTIDQKIKVLELAVRVIEAIGPTTVPEPDKRIKAVYENFIDLLSSERLKP